MAKTVDLRDQASDFLDKYRNHLSGSDRSFLKIIESTEPEKLKFKTTIKGTKLLKTIQRRTEEKVNSGTPAIYSPETEIEANWRGNLADHSTLSIADTIINIYTGNFHSSKNSSLNIALPTSSRQLDLFATHATQNEAVYSVVSGLMIETIEQKVGKVVGEEKVSSALIKAEEVLEKIYENLVNYSKSKSIDLPNVRTPSDINSLFWFTRYNYDSSLETAKSYIRLSKTKYVNNGKVRSDAVRDARIRLAAHLLGYSINSVKGQNITNVLPSIEV